MHLCTYPASPQACYYHVMWNSEDNVCVVLGPAFRERGGLLDIGPRAPPIARPWQHRSPPLGKTAADEHNGE